MCWQKLVVAIGILFPPVLIVAKINLNTLSKETLAKLYFSPEQIKDFFNHKKKYGDFIDVKELYTIPTFDDFLIRHMQELYYANKYPPEQYEYDYKIRDKKVFFNCRYVRKKWEFYNLGPEDNIVVKFRYRDLKKFETGLLAFKKPGEERFVFDIKSARFLFNSYNAFAQWTNIGPFKNIIIGNFNVGSGQGLVFNSSFGFGKPFDWMIPMVIQDGITPSLSTYQCKFTGLANTIVAGDIKISSFIAYNFLDANIVDGRVFSVKRRNEYKTKKDIAKRNKLQEFIIGGIVQYIHPSDDFEIGINIVNTKFDKIFKLSDKANLGYLFKGRLNTNASLFSRCLIGPAQVFFEYARSFKNIDTKYNILVKNSPDALIVGHITNIFKSFYWTCVFRKYNPTYYNFYGRGMHVNGGSNCSGLHGCACNEASLYNAFLLKVLQHWEVSSCIDFFAVLYKAYKYDQMKGHDFRFKINYSFYKNDYVRLEVRHNYKNQKKRRGKNISTRNLLVKINGKVVYDNIVFCTQIQIPFNLKKKNHKTNFCLYECVDVDLEVCKVSLFFVISQVSAQTPVYIKEKGNNTWSKFGAPCNKIGFCVVHKFSCGLKLSIVLHFFARKIFPGLQVDMAYEF